MGGHPQPGASIESPAKTPQKHSCALCQQRKVKCDRSDPCAGCRKLGIECIFRAPAPPRRRKRRIPETDLHAKLKHYETLLTGYGAKIEELQYSKGDDCAALEQNGFGIGEASIALPHRQSALPKSASQSQGIPTPAPSSEGSGFVVEEKGGSKFLESYALTENYWNLYLYLTACADGF